MVSCLEAVQQYCSPAELQGLTMLLGGGRAAPAARKKTGMSVPETETTTWTRYKDVMVFLYNCDDPPGCKVQKFDEPYAMTRAAESVWGRLPVKPEHAGKYPSGVSPLASVGLNNIQAFESPRFANAKILPDQLRNSLRPYNFKVYGPDVENVPAWEGYGGTKNKAEVLKGTACPGEVTEKFQWRPADLVSGKAPLTVRRIDKNEGYVEPKDLPPMPEKLLKASEMKPEEKPPPAKVVGTVQKEMVIAGAKFYKATTPEGKVTYLNERLETVPEEVVKAAQQAEREAKKEFLEGKK